MVAQDFVRSKSERGRLVANEKKLKSLIAHIAKERPRLGKVKLFKLMYLIDFTAYSEIGHSVTGEMYESFPMGPVPTTLWHRFQEITRECVSVESVDTGLMPEQQMTALPTFTPDLDVDELRVANRI